MSRRYIGKALKSELAQTGRFAGSGISEDNYSEESFPDFIPFNPTRCRSSIFKKAESDPEPAEVITYMNGVRVQT